MTNTAPKLDIAREHILFQHKNADGFITLAKKDHTTGRFVQHHYRPEELAAHLSEWTGEDVFFSQQTFYKPRRLVENIRQLRSLYVDIDFYLFNYDVNWILGKLETEFYKQTMPEPNLIIFSGQGVVLVWLIEPVIYKALPLWQAVQSYLYNQLKDLGGDPLACDAARVFRLAGTVSGKNGAEVHVEYRHEHRYELRQIQYDYLPELTHQEPHKKGRKKKIVSLFNRYTLNFNRLEDLKKLVQLRNGHVTGFREKLLFMFRYWSCCFTKDPQQALEETIEFNNTFSHPLNRSEVVSATKSAQTAFEAKSNAEADRIAKEKGYPGAGYNISNTKLIEWFDIDQEEQMHLITIIGRKEKNRRRTIERRKNGIIPREEYRAIKKTKAELVKEYIENNPEANNSQIARDTGISRRSVIRYIQEGQLKENINQVTVKQELTPKRKEYLNKKQSKVDIIREYLIQNPMANNSQIARETGISRRSIIRYRQEIETAAP